MSSSREFKIVFAKRVQKDFKKISAKNKKAIKTKLSDKLLVNPIGNSDKTQNPNLPAFKFRVGDYRILFDIDTKKGQIIIKKIGLRNNVYN